MAYQDVERAQIVPSRDDSRIEDDAVRASLAKLRIDLFRVSQEVVNCHNRVLNFAVSVGNGLTTLAIAMPAPMPDTLYYVGVQANFDNGGTWVTNKTTTGFTLNWATATVGTQAVRFLIVD